VRLVVLVLACAGVEADESLVACATSLVTGAGAGKIGFWASDGLGHVHPSTSKSIMELLLSMVTFAGDKLAEEVRVFLCRRLAVDECIEWPET